MSIKVMNCFSISPYYPKWKVGTTCILVKSDQGYVLIDTGLGIHDYKEPSILVKFFMKALRANNSIELTAINQCKKINIEPNEIKHIILTHMHFDHAGGLPDFPNANIHIHNNEYKSLKLGRNKLLKGYDWKDILHKPKWILYDTVTDNWRGFEAIRLPFNSPEMYLIPLFGHTKGHCGVAIKDNEKWIFQCADALPTNAEFDITPDWLNRLIIGSHVKKIKNWAKVNPDVNILAGHMWIDYFEKS
jgi:glyoxylase-like metal-dependent hydrolase (beta-lactamase superfamily II)